MTAGNGWVKGVLLPAAAVVLAVFAAYYVTLGYGFVYDDKAQILGNRWILGFGNIPEVFGSHSFGFMEESYLAITYRPMFFVIYMVEYALFGFEAWGWHLVNVLIHSANSVLVFLLARQVLIAERPSFSPALPAFAAALVFALHPMNAEPVSWLASIGELSFTFLCLSALLLETRAIDGARRPFVEAVFSRVAPAVFFLGAILLKETAVALPVIVLAYDAARRGIRRPFSLERVLRYVPYAAALAVYTLMRAWALKGEMTPPARLHPFLSGYEFALNSVTLLARYFKSLVLPVGEPPLQLLEPVFSLSEPRAFVSLLVALAVPVVAAVLLRRITRLWPVILITVMLPILPTLYSPAISRFPFADRYLYFPSIGLAVLVAIVLGWLLSHRGRLGVWATVAVLAVCVPAAVYARARSGAWHDEMTLWQTALRAQPGNYAALHAMAADHLREGRAQEALGMFEGALEMNLASSHPDETMVLLTRKFLPQASIKAGDYDGAERHLEEFIKLMPDDAPALYNLGHLRQRKGLCADAVDSYQRASVFSRNPKLSRMIYYNLGECQEALGMRAEAAASFSEAMRLSPGDPEIAGRLRALEAGR